MQAKTITCGTNLSSFRSLIGIITHDRINLPTFLFEFEQEMEEPDFALDTDEL